MKIDLVLRSEEFTSFTSYYLEEFWNKFFNVSWYDPDKTYDKTRTLFAVWWANVNNDPWIEDMKQQGYKIVVDNLWEGVTHRTDYYWIEHPRSMCWNESLWWHALGYSAYRPQKDLQYRALMQLRSRKPARDMIVEHLNSLLPEILWSYLPRNQMLPNDTTDALQGQRYMHPSWYDQTFCSLVVETGQTGNFHVSEKSYKPLAYYHPCIIFGVPGTLKFLRDYGFETFENIFDESYDVIDNFDQRLEIIERNIEIIELDHYDKLTQDKIQHNHALFFNEDLVLKNIQHYVVEPLIHYAET